jgi:hypothetical protein
MPAVDACAWWHSTDAIVWGTVQDVLLVDDLLITNPSTSGWQWVDGCEGGWVMPALKIVLDVKHSLRGDLRGTIEVRAGSEHVSLLNPVPYVSADGTVAWEEQRARPGSPLVRGQEVGLALHAVAVGDTTMWSLLGEGMFGLSNEGKLVFGSGVNECFEQPPGSVPGSSLAQAQTLLSECTQVPESLAAQERRERLRRSWYESYLPPTYYVAGLCQPRDHEVPPCTSDADCPADRPKCMLDGLCLDG